MALTDAEIQATKVPFGKNQFKVSDGGGLYLLVKSSGQYWKLAYRFEGKQKTLAFGVYPAVSIDAAREKRDVAKNLLAQNIDPGLIRKQERVQQREASVAVENNPQTSLSHERSSRKRAQVVELDPAEQQKTEKRRLSILQILVDSQAYSSDEHKLQSLLETAGFSISCDRLRTDIAWLYEMQLIQLDTSSLWHVYLTQPGLDAAQGRTWIPGISRPAKEAGINP